MKIIKKRKISDFNDVVRVTGPKYLLLEFEKFLKDSGIKDDIPWNTTRRWDPDYINISAYLHTNKYCYYDSNSPFDEIQNVKDFI